MTTPEPKPSLVRMVVLFLIPIVLLVGVIALFLVTAGAGLNVRPAAPIESLAQKAKAEKPPAEPPHDPLEGDGGEHPEAAEPR